MKKVDDTSIYISPDGKTRAWIEFDDESSPTHLWIYTEQRSVLRSILNDETLGKEIKETVCPYIKQDQERPFAWQVRFPKKHWNRFSKLEGMPKIPRGALATPAPTLAETTPPEQPAKTKRAIKPSKSEPAPVITKSKPVQSKSKAPKQPEKKAQPVKATLSLTGKTSKPSKPEKPKAPGKRNIKEEDPGTRISATQKAAIKQIASVMEDSAKLRRTKRVVSEAKEPKAGKVSKTKTIDAQIQEIVARKKASFESTRTLKTIQKNTRSQSKKAAV